jgi:hypothetical protein
MLRPDCRIHFCKDKADWLEKKKLVVTSTETAYLFNQQPGGKDRYSLQDLWNAKKSKTPLEHDLNERMESGLAMEEAIAGIACRRHGWTSRAVHETMFFEIPEMGLGTSLDNFGWDAEGRMFVMETKNVGDDSFRFGAWQSTKRTREIIKAPPYIEIQCQTQLLVTGLRRLALCVFVGGNRFFLGTRYPIPVWQAAIAERARLFKASLEAAVVPDGTWKRALVKFDVTEAPC